MGERLLCKQEVDGSIPFTSTRTLGRQSPLDRRGRRIKTMAKVRRRTIVPSSVFCHQAKRCLNGEEGFIERKRGRWPPVFDVVENLELLVGCRRSVWV